MEYLCPLCGKKPHAIKACWTVPKKNSGSGLVIALFTCENEHKYRAAIGEYEEDSGKIRVRITLDNALKKEAKKLLRERLKKKLLDFN